MQRVGTEMGTVRAAGVGGGVYTPDRGTTTTTKVKYVVVVLPVHCCSTEEESDGDVAGEFN